MFYNYKYLNLYKKTAIITHRKKRNNLIFIEKISLIRLIKTPYKYIFKIDCSQSSVYHLLFIILNKINTNMDFF